MRGSMESQSKKTARREQNERLNFLIEALKPTDFARDQHLAFEQRSSADSGEWLLKSRAFQDWKNVEIDTNPVLYLHGVPGSGK